MTSGHAPRNTNENYVICATVEGAKAIAAGIRAGEYPVLYRTGTEALAAWMQQPLACEHRYHVWRVTHTSGDTFVEQLTDGMRVR